MADRVMIAWNFWNWVTVLLMAAAGYAVLALAAQLTKGSGTTAQGGGF